MRGSGRRSVLPVTGIGLWTVKLKFKVFGAKKKKQPRDGIQCSRYCVRFCAIGQLANSGRHVTSNLSVLAPLTWAFIY